jgi:aryl-alcohol dehydrogenase-like predicted oxidoreductase
MQYRILGRTGLQCSEIGLGTWAFGSSVYGDVTARDAQETIRAALAAGITVFDTAPLYGNRERDGIAEEALGRALGSDRDKVLISSKFGRNATERAAPNFHARRARESVEASLRRLGTDHLDVLFFHSPFGPDDIHDDVWQALADLKKEGKVRFVGHSISMFQDTEAMARAWAADRKIDVVQVVYSLMNREAAAFIRDLSEQGIGIVARESLANGFLSGTIRRDTVFPAGTLNARYPPEEIAERAAYVEQLDFLVRGEVHTMPQAAFRWVLDDIHVSLVLSGARNTRELSDALAASTTEGNSQEEHRRADSIHTRDFQAA